MFSNSPREGKRAFLLESLSLVLYSQKNSGPGVFESPRQVQIFLMRETALWVQTLKYILAGITQSLIETHPSEHMKQAQSFPELQSARPCFGTLSHH